MSLVVLETIEAGQLEADMEINLVVADMEINLVVADMEINLGVLDVDVYRLPGQVLQMIGKMSLGLVVLETIEAGQMEADMEINLVVLETMDVDDFVDVEIHWVMVFVAPDPYHMMQYHSSLAHLKKLLHRLQRQPKISMMMMMMFGLGYYHWYLMLMLIKIMAAPSTSLNVIAAPSTW